MTKSRAIMKQGRLDCTYILLRWQKLWRPSQRWPGRLDGGLFAVVAAAPEGSHMLGLVGVVQAEEGGVDDYLLVDQGGAEKWVKPEIGIRPVSVLTFDTSKAHRSGSLPTCRSSKWKSNTL